jgi:hypothetical protein
VESPVPPSAVAGYYCWLASKIAKGTPSDAGVTWFSKLRDRPAHPGRLNFPENGGCRNAVDWETVSFREIHVIHLQCACVFHSGLNKQRPLV